MPSEAVVYIVDDDEAIRKSLTLLMKAEGHQPMACASAREFLDTYDGSRPGCLVLDVRMPGMSGLELQELLSSTGIRLPVIVMTGHGDVAMAVRAMKSGAKDFIEKPFQNQTLLDRLAEALAEDREDRAQRAALAAAVERIKLLTRRERETLDLLVAGKLNKQVAADLNISVRTVEAHRARIMEKLGVKSLSELVRLSIMAG